MLDDVGRGETITITKHGVDVAVLAPAAGRARVPTADAIAALREFRWSHALDGLSVRELIDEGRC